MAKKHKASHKKKADSSGKKIYKGRLEVTRSGMGFVVVEGLEKDVMIKRGQMLNALNGDEVRVEVSERGKKFDSRPEGEIIEVTRRKQTEFSGKIDVHPHFAFLITDSDKMPLDIYIPLHLLNGAKHGDQAMVRMIEWTGKY